MTENGHSLVYRKKVRCTCEWEVKFGYGVAFTLAVFEAKRLLVIALEIFTEWQVIRIAGGFQPVVLALIDVALGLPCALITVRAIRRRKSYLHSKTRQVLKCLLIMIITCIAMNTMTLALIGYHISVRQETLIDIFNASMHLYATAASHKYAIDEIQFVLQCCGHSSYTDWFLFDWQMIYRCVPLRTSFPQVRSPTAPFTIMNASRTYVPRLFSLKKSVRRKKPSLHYCPLMTKDIFIMENRKSSSSKVRCRYPILNHGNRTWDVAKIKPSVHEEHKISMECRRNKCTR